MHLLSIFSLVLLLNVNRASTATVSCSADGRSGVCVSTSSCSGTSIPGHCPGSSNVQCCIEEEESESCEVQGQQGVCKDTGTCKGTSHAGKCSGAKNIQCCVQSAPVTGSGSSDGLCGSYTASSVSLIQGNNEQVYSVVKIQRAHLSTPSSYDLKSTESDNTMTTKTACAFDKMHEAAKKAGITITIASGFRTLARQEYFYNCYLTKKCNNGNLAAKPNTSNHGKGIALDLNTNCGKQAGETPPTLCNSSNVYVWLKTNAHTFGFTRTVKTEPWHWEFRGTGVQPATYS